MKPISIDFIPAGSKLPIRWLLLGFGAISFFVISKQLFEIKDTLTEAQQSIARKEQSERNSKLPLLPSKDSLETELFVSATTKSISYPWNQVFREMEAIKSDGVLLMAFNHHQAKKQTKLEIQILSTEQLKEALYSLEDVSGVQYRWAVASLTSSPPGYRAVIYGDPLQ